MKMIYQEAHNCQS